MRVRRLHPWNLTPREATRLQQRLRGRLRIEPLGRPVRLVAGADVAYDDATRTVFAGVVVLAWPALEVVERAWARRPEEFPYVPGLLSFREAPALLDAFAKLRGTPDAVLFDGHGYAHPRRFGLACHVGMLLDLPAVGAAKSRLVGEHRQPGPRRGNRARLVDGGETIGTVLRTRDGVRPIYVSIGYRIDLPGAVRLALGCARRYRVPEPTRLADQFVARLKREGS